MSAKGTRAVEVVRAAGVGVVVHEYEVSGPAGPRYRERRPSTASTRRRPSASIPAATD